MRTRIPASLFIGLVVGFCGTFAQTTIFTLPLSENADWERWELFNAGCVLAANVMVSSALFAIASQQSRWHRTLFQIAGWFYAAIVAWSLVQPVLVIVEPGESTRTVISYIWSGVGAVGFAATIAITIASRAWTRSALTIVCAVAVCLFEGLGGWTPYFGSWLFGIYDEHPKLSQLYWLFRELVWGVGILTIVHCTLSDAPPALTDPRQASHGFRLAGMSLLARVVAAIALAAIGIGLIKTASAIKVMLVLGPSVVILTTVAFAWGILMVERSALDRMARIRLALGAAITLWSAGIALYQMTNAYEIAMHESSGTTSWVIAAPIIAVIGMILILSAIHTYAIQIGDDRLRQAAAGRMTVYIVLSALTALLPLAMLGTRDPGSLVVVVVLAALCGIVAVILVAGLMSIAAETLGGGPTLPQARLRS